MRKKGLTLPEAVLELRKFQDWRRGYDCRTQKDAGIDNRKLGQAIDKILRHHGMGRPLRNCERCRNYNAMFGVCYLVHHNREKCPVNEPAVKK